MSSCLNNNTNNHIQDPILKPHFFYFKSEFDYAENPRNRNLRPR